MSKRLILIAALIALTASALPLAAQPVSGSAGDGPLALRAYWIANFSTGGNAMIGVTAGGTIDTIITLTGANGPDSVCMGPDNDLLVVADTTGVWTQRLSAGPAPVFTTLVGTGISWLDTDEDGGFVYCTQNGEIYHISSIGATPVLVRNDAGFQWNSICWDGGTGNYIAARFGSGTAGQLHAICRTGVCIATYGPPIASISGVDWDPLYDEIAVSSFNTPYLFTVNRWGMISTLGPTLAAINTPNSIEVLENPQSTLGVPQVAGDRYIGGEFGSTPNHIFGKRRNNVTPPNLYLASASIGPADVEVMWSRQVWGLNAAKAGGLLRLSVYFPSQAGQTYILAASFGHLPGLSLGGLGTAYVNPDPLFYMSAASVGAPFANFVGTLNVSGRATSTPVISLPNSPGLRFYVAGITVSGNRITEVSNCYGVTIQP